MFEKRMDAVGETDLQMDASGWRMVRCKVSCPPPLVNHRDASRTPHVSIRGDERSEDRIEARETHQARCMARAESRESRKSRAIPRRGLW